MPTFMIFNKQRNKNVNFQLYNQSNTELTSSGQFKADIARAKTKLPKSTA